AVELSAEPQYIPCRPSAIWSLLRPPGSEDVQRMIVSVTDATGARAWAVAEHRLVRPLPAPIRLRVESALVRSQSATITAEWGAPYRHREERADGFAIRWRNARTGDWQVEHVRPDQPVSWTVRHSWEVNASAAGEQLELQAAQLRHVHDLQAPAALNWSEAATVVTLAPPQNLQAEASHDSITLRWGPHATRLVYVARLDPVLVGRHTDRQTLRVDHGPVYVAHFGDLLPDTLYLVEVALAQGSRYAHALGQHRFELRTEPAPLGWSAPSRNPSDISVTVVEGELEVTWKPPETGTRYETVVCAEPAHTWWYGTCEVAPPGRSHVRITLDGHLVGGTFVVSAETRTAPSGFAEAELHVPTYSPEIPTQGAPAQAPRFHELNWHHHPENPRPGTWTFVWDHEGADLAEVSWQEGGRTVIREVDHDSLSIDMEYGEIPGSVQVRLLRDDSWTPWSAAADVPNIARPVFPVRITERLDALEVQWDPLPDDSEVVGYRIYLARNKGPEEVIEVGKQTSAQIPIEQTDETYRVSAAALVRGPIEMGRSFATWHERQDQLPPPALAISIWQASSWCPPAPGGRIRVQWTVEGGTPPFTVSVADNLGFETEQRSGLTTVACPERDTDGQASLQAQVMDANRQSSDRTVMWRDLYEVERHVDEDPFAVHVNMRSVHRDHVLLRWDCWYVPYEAALRWRLVGERGWTYETSFPQSRGGYGDFRCRGTWSNLHPNTTYEFQLAHYEREAQLRRPDLLRWSDTKTVTTLGPPQELAIERDGETITVRWKRQPDAWAYVVGLRTEGRSWWKRYEPSGEQTETVMFRGIPSDLSVNVELISPPLDGGVEARPAWFDEVIVTGH
ncbi:MAG: hypothetical protein OXG27_10185, partial [Chloroflexi bacterium]|nr:hypothetical protein [Chloroflexota bacterium]